MRRRPLLMEISKSLMEDVLKKIDPDKRLKFANVKVTTTENLKIHGLLHGVDLVCFFIGDGEILMMFDFDYSPKLMAKLTKSNPKWMENPRAFIESLLVEIGNVIVGLFGGKLSGMMGREILPSVPFFIKDLSKLEKVLEALSDGLPLPVVTGEIKDGGAGWVKVYIVPSRRFLDELDSLVFNGGYRNFMKGGRS